MLDLARALPPWYRQRALADLDRLLAQLEDSTPSSPRQTRQRRAAAAQQAARSAAPEDRLILLRHGRQVLLAAQSEPEAKAA